MWAPHPFLTLIEVTPSLIISSNDKKVNDAKYDYFN